MISGQVAIDFEFDDRVPRLAKEIALVLVPHVSSDVSTESLRRLAERVAMLAGERLRHAWEPAEPMRCHTCDRLVGPRERVRVVVCARCSLEGGSPGSAG